MLRKGKFQSLSDSNIHINKIATLKASQFVVSIISHNLPAEVWESFDVFVNIAGPPPKEAIFFGCGIILESHLSATNVSYLSTILAPASLFKDIPADKIDIDVYVLTGVSYKAQLLACDFHYNLALLTINSVSQLPTAVFTGIDDVLSIDPTDQPYLPHKHEPFFGLRPCSPLFKVAPQTPIFSVSRSHIDPLDLRPGSGTLCLRAPKGLSCNELYEIKDARSLGLDGAPVVNSLSQIIGMVFGTSFFLPSNVILRWWNHYKTYREFCRPFHGMEVVNLSEADFDFLSRFTTRFTKVSTAVVVTKVEEGSPACRSGVLVNDVIVKLDGNLVRSKLEFCESLWKKAGPSLEVSVCRVSDGEQLNLDLLIEEATPNKFHEWPRPTWRRLW